MAAARRVAEEVLGHLRQTTLLALRRSILPTRPGQSTRKSDLIADLATACDAMVKRQQIFAEALTDLTMHELRLILARLKGLGYMVAIGKRPKHQDLIAAIVNTTEYTKGNSPARCKDVCSSTNAPETPRQAMERPAMESSSCMALVAIDSVADPLKLQQRLRKRWRKKWAKYTWKNVCKHKLKRIKDEVRHAFQEYGATSTIGELRVLVGRTLGLPLDGKHRWHFDKALLRLTNPPPTKRRARRRFSIAKISKKGVKLEPA